jgi:hypothetical protein
MYVALAEALEAPIVTRSLGWSAAGPGGLAEPVEQDHVRHRLGSIHEECATAVDPTRPKRDVKLARKADGDPPCSRGYVVHANRVPVTAPGIGDAHQFRVRTERGHCISRLAVTPHDGFVLTVQKAHSAGRH